MGFKVFLGEGQSSFGLVCLHLKRGAFCLCRLALVWKLWSVERIPPKR
jgi:hypothetical protein